MTCDRASRWLLATAVLMTALFLGCKGNSKSTPPPENTVKVSGHVTYTRIPLLKDANGIPTGLETAPANYQQNLPARGIMVRLFRYREETALDGVTLVPVRTLITQTTTDQDGRYSMTITPGNNYCVELISRETSTASVRIVADLTTPVLDRPVYALRKALDGTSTGIFPHSKADGNVTLDFNVDVDTQWLLASTTETKVMEAVQEPVGTGSSVLGILDSIWTFAAVYGAPSTGLPLDLHYKKGVTTGTFVDFKPSPVGPTSNYHQGSIRGEATNDDAWDEAVLFTLFARNQHYKLQYAYFDPFPLKTPFGAGPRDDQQKLSPDLALAMGVSEAMAANLLKSPYLADTYASGGTSVSWRDIRDLMGLDEDIYSGPAIAEMAWKMIVKANSLVSDTAGEWTKIDPQIFHKFFPTNSNPLAFSNDSLATLYTLIPRLQAARSPSDPVVLNTIFTDTYLTPFLADYGMTWPLPTPLPDGLVFRKDWGANFTPPPPAITLSMADAVPAGDGKYPNASKGEVYYAKFTLARNGKYDLDITPPPASSYAIEVQIGNGGGTYTFTDTSATPRITLLGGGTTIFFPVRVRILSPDTKVTEPVTHTLTFAKVL